CTVTRPKAFEHPRALPNVLHAKSIVRPPRAGRTRRMSSEIPRESFSDADHARFAKRLQEPLDALDLVLARPDFGTGPTTLGAELEMSLVDAEGRPLPVNRAVLASAPH